MKLRIEGTQSEIKLAEKIIQAGLKSQGGQVESISKFYANQAFGFERSAKQETGRVYIEIRP
jgi:hypothetical protein